MKSYLTQYFDTEIKPLADRLAELMDGEAKVNDLSHYDHDGIKHIFVFDEDFAHDGYELIDGQWVEKAPF